MLPCLSRYRERGPRLFVRGLSLRTKAFPSAESQQVLVHKHGTVFERVQMDLLELPLLDFDAIFLVAHVGLAAWSVRAMPSTVSGSAMPVASRIVGMMSMT